MSSTERAPEPTMEEILASIRRIISDDESSSARQRSAPQSQPDEEGLDGAEGEADDEIINDIARVLKGSGANAAPAAPASPAMEEEEDILDLTAELGGLDLVEDIEDIEDIEMVEVVAEAAPDIYQTAPARPQPVVASPVVASSELELELLDEVAPEAAEAEASAPEPAPEPKKAPVAAQAPAAPPRMSASEEAASALERAIAALRAGQVPTSSSPFSFRAQPEPSPVPEAAPPVAVAPSYEPVPMPPPIAAAPSYEPLPVPEPTPMAEPELELVLAELEVEMIDAEPVMVVEVPVSEPRMEQAWGMGATSSWATQPELEIDDDPELPRVNGGGAYQPYAAEGASKSLEDSIKDMLRPMLRQWLDENMARVLTAALQDEIKNNPSRLQGD